MIFKIKKIRFLYLTVFCFLFAHGLSFASVEKQLKIRVKDKVKVTSGSVIMKDIADISGSNKELVKKVANIVLIRRLPQNLYKIVSIHKRRILSRLRQKRIDLKKVDFNSPEEVTVGRATISVSKEDIQQLIEDYLFEEEGLMQSDVEIKRCNAKDILLPEGEIRFRVAPRNNSKFSGYTAFYIDVAVNGKQWKKLYVDLYIDKFKDIVVTNKGLRAGTVLDADALLLERRSIIALKGNYYTNVDEILGKAMRRNLRFGEVIKRRDVKEHYLLNRGDKITILLETQSLKLSTVGIANEKGKKGDFIDVLNIVSKKNVVAEVVDSQTVKVRF